MSAHPHTPWRVYSTHAIFEADTSHIWPLLEDFGGLARLMPKIVTSCSLAGEGVGAVRTLTFSDGTVAKEILIGLQPEHFRLSYSMEDPAPCPWKNYFCTQQLQPLGGDQTHLLVTGYCHSAERKDGEASDIMREVYRALFEGIARTLNVRAIIQPN